MRFFRTISRSLCSLVLLFAFLLIGCGLGNSSSDGGGGSQRSIRVDPTSITVATGQTATFHVYTIGASPGAFAVPDLSNAGGGKVTNNSSGGLLFTAGNIPGNYSIVLKVEDLSTVLSVTVTGSPGGSSNGGGSSGGNGGSGGGNAKTGIALQSKAKYSSVQWLLYDKNNNLVQSSFVSAGETTTIDASPGNYMLEIDFLGIGGGGGDPGLTKKLFVKAPVTVVAGSVAKATFPVGQLKVKWTAASFPVSWDLLDTSQVYLSHNHFTDPAENPLDLPPGSYIVRILADVNHSTGFTVASATVSDGQLTTVQRP